MYGSFIVPIPPDISTLDFKIIKTVISYPKNIKNNKKKEYINLYS